MRRISHVTREPEYANHDQKTAVHTLDDDGQDGRVTACWEVGLDPLSYTLYEDYLDENSLDEEDLDEDGIRAREFTIRMDREIRNSLAEFEEEHDPDEDDPEGDQDDAIRDRVLRDPGLWYIWSIGPTVEQNPLLDAEQEKARARDVQAMRHYKSLEQGIKHQAGTETGPCLLAVELVKELVSRIVREAPMLWAAGLWLNLAGEATLGKTVKHPKMLAALEAVPNAGMIAFIADVLNISENDVPNRWAETGLNLSILPSKVLADHGHLDLRSLSEALDLIRADLTRGINPSLYAWSFREMSSRAEEARSTLVAANLRLVQSRARKLGQLRQRMDLLNDLVGEGNVALIAAAEHFDHRKGARFSTYATTCIDRAINNFISCNGSYALQVPPRVLRDVNNAVQSRQRLLDELGRPPSLLEVAQATRTTEKRADELLQASSNFQPSLYLYQAVPGATDGSVYADILPDRCPSVEDQVCNQLMVESVMGEVEKLPDRERHIIRRRFLSDDPRPPTFAAVAKELESITGERVRQLQEKALKKLRS